MFWQRKKENKKYTGELADAVRFTQAALQWSKTFGVIGDVKAACMAAGIQAEHARAVDAVFGVDSCIMKLMRVRDYNEMLEEEHKLSAAAKYLMETMRELSDIAHVRRIDVSMTSPILKSLAAVLEARAMLKE